MSPASQLLPPVARIEGFLGEQELSALLNWVFANQERFRPATVSRQDDIVVDAATRRALTTRDFHSDLDWLQGRFSAAQGQLLEMLRLTVPAIETVELELAAHGDGAHFAPHVDIPLGPGRKPLGGRPGRTDDRLFSAVYYFHREPKGFQGGNLRLFPLGADPKSEALDDAQYIDIEPTQNALVAFPSWATHEVRSIRCPSGEFTDYRFAVNCWYCGQFKG